MNCEISNFSHLRKHDCNRLMNTYIIFLICALALVKPAYMAVETFFDCTSFDDDEANGVLIKCPHKEIKPHPGEPSTTSYTGTCTCIFHNKFTQPFNLSSGPKFVRLYFTQPLDFNTSKARFTIRLGKYTLLQTSNYSYASHPLSKDIIIREFVVNMDDPVLNITFIPSLTPSDSYAFVNKIEVVSIPLDLYIRNTQLPLVGKKPLQSYTGDRMALETMYRVNVGGPTISPQYDSSMSRSWKSDERYFNDYTKTEKITMPEVEIKYSAQVPPYTAPILVYCTARGLSDTFSFPGNAVTQGNLSWSFPVESGFYDLIRFHFCEIRKNAIRVNGRYFQIYIKNRMAEDHVDVVSWSSGTDIPVYKDYIIESSTHNQTTKSLLISLLVDTEFAASYAAAILNGLEIFKLPDSSGNLAGILPFGTEDSYDIEPAMTFKKIISDFGYVLLAFLLCSYLFLFKPVIHIQIWFLHLKAKLRSPSQESDGCRRFSLTSMKLATNNFSNSFLLGIGGFGKVYKGFIEEHGDPVAIKRADPNSHQGLHEFQTEISMLSKLRHRHLVSLIGYCMEGKEMMLVYKFMEHGTLRDHLYNSQNPPLNWIQRLKICIGAARGLHYLHTGSKQTIIHRDVKSTNILLDNEWEAKVSDFGLSKFGPDMINQSHTHVSTMVKGSIGYLDPEYYRRMKLTEKSDVYSFGVVLFEVLCAKPAILAVEEEEDEAITLAALALKCYREGTWDQTIDPFLIGKTDPECFRTFTNVAKWCLADKGCNRPSMGEVLSHLELALQQQRYANGLCRSPNRVCAHSVTIMDHNIPVGTSNSDQHLGIEFSEILHPSAR